MDTVNLAVVGATGAVGEAVVELLNDSIFPVSTLHLLASDRTAGTSLRFRGQPMLVNILEQFDFTSVDMVIFVANDAVSEEYIPKAVAAGCLVIDNSQAFDQNSDYPLVIPSVNGDQLTTAEKPSVVVNPDSSVVSLWTVLKPIYDTYGIERVNVTAYDSVSRHGKKAIHELATQTASLLNGQGADPKFYPQQIAFNVLPSVGAIDDDGYTASEKRIVEQSKRLMNDPLLQVNATCIQVPVFYADSMAVTIKTADSADAQAIREILEKHAEIVVVDQDNNEELATPVTTASGKNDIFVSRIRNDLSHSRSINLWIVSDNVRKGAALNSIMIAEELKKAFL